MRKRLVVIIVFVVILIGLSVSYVFMTPTAHVPSVKQASSPTPSPVADTSTAPANSGRYVTYTDKTISSTTGTKLLFFHAPWCPQCRALDKDITATTLPSDVTVIKVDYDSHQSLRQKYGVTIQTTIVKVDDQGNFVEKYVAYSQPTFISVKQNLLD